MKRKPIYVTSPLMPDYDDFTALVRQLWDTRLLTNNGPLLRRLEEEIGAYLGERHVSVYANGTLPLLAAFRALGLKGEVITTPYTFVATSHALTWCGLTPVYADIDPATGNLDPASVESLVGPRTCAILPVHVYGRPCRTEEIEEIARRHGLKVVYDAAHAFGVRCGGRPITSWGDVATLSFHATKVFSTIEGGAVVCRDGEMKKEFDRLRNFGFESETCISAVGINAKLDEMRAAFGLLNLRKVDDAIERRKAATALYRTLLGGQEHISLPPEPESGLRHNYSHFPIVASGNELREKIYSTLRSEGIFPRRYFYPLVTDFKPYNACRGAGETPNARALSERVLCLPLHADLPSEEIHRIADLVRLSLG